MSVTVSCDEDVGEVDEVEELVDQPGTTNGTSFDVSQCIIFGIYDEMWFLATRSMVTVPIFFEEFSK